MINGNMVYAEAITEVLTILEYTEKEMVDKIPKKFIAFLEENSSKTYKPNFDCTKPIKDLKLKPKTEAILGIIYLKYWANEDEKIAFRKRARRNEEECQRQLREKYNTDNLFKNVSMKMLKDNQKQELLEIKEKTFIQELVRKIKVLFGGKRK